MSLEWTALVLQIPFISHMILKVHQGNFQNGNGMCDCHRITLEHIGMVGTYTSLVFPKIWLGDDTWNISRDSKEKCQFPICIEILILNVEKLKLTYDCYILSILIMGLYALNVF